MQGVFITGTNTDVGKTHVGVLLVKALRKKNIKVIPRKPIESGCNNIDGELVPADAIALMKASGYSGELTEVCPYRFEPPISPVRAAHLANRTVTTAQLVNTCLNGSENGFTLVEGAGGIYSPLTEDGLNADLAAALQLPVLLIAEDTIGCINQVLLSVEAIKLRGLKLIGVVLNNIHDNRDVHMDNAADLRERLDCDVFCQAHGSNSTVPDDLVDTVIDQAEMRVRSVAG